MDPLGHGSSDRPHDPESYVWPDVALDVVAAMDEAGVERAPLWGFSRGTWLATTVAVEAPDRVTALVLGAGYDIGETPPMARTPAIEALLAGDWAAFFATPGGSFYQEATRRYHERVNDPVAFGAASAGRRLRPYTIDLARISAPALVYVGSEDQPELSRRTADALGVELVELPGLDHRTGLMATDVVMAVVAPFLATTT